MKKGLGYLFLFVLVIFGAVGVYFFVTKGYSGKMALQTITQNVPDTNISEEKRTEVAGQVVSDKIGLTVTSPENGTTLSSTNVNVKGKTSPNADVFVNDQFGKADVNGNFSISLGLDEGQNQIVIDANDADGNVAEKTLTVNVASF